MKTQLHNSAKLRSFTFKSVLTIMFAISLAINVQAQKVVFFAQANLTSDDVIVALDAAGIGADEEWIAVLKNTVKTLEEYAFYVDNEPRCANLVEIQGGNEVTTIGNFVFYRCESLKAVSFPKVTAIGGKAFEGCVSLETASFSLVTEIDYGAFYYCINLQTASFPVLTKIGGNAFYYCEGLETASFPLVTTIGYFSFYQCKSLKAVSFPLVTTIGNNTFGNCVSLASLSVGTGLTVATDIWFGDDVFFKVSTQNIDLTLGVNVNINDINIANKLYKSYAWKSINGGNIVASKIVTFSQPNLTDKNVTSALDAAGVVGYDDKWIAVLESTVEMIGGCAFDAINNDARCRNLVAVEGEGGNNIKTIGGKAFQSCESLVTLPFPILTKIGENALSGCRSLKTESFPLLTEINNEALRFCKSLETLSLPIITKIGNYAFLSSTGLTSLSLGTGFTVTTEIVFGYDVFYGVSTKDIDLILGTNVDVSGTDTDIANKLYKGYTWKSIGIGGGEGIGEITAVSPAKAIGYYSIMGQRLANEPQSGVYIVKFDNGKAEKRMK